MYQEENKIKNKKILLFLGIGIIVLSIIGAVVILLDNKKTKLNSPKEEEPKGDEIKKPEEKPEEKPSKDKITIIDLESKSRPYAVMINNHPEARPLQSGLQDAYIIYEMQVEYGLTRIMALFKDKNTTRIGSVRSSRHTYLDYSMENDAIYVHFGFSNLAEQQIPKFGINNLNGLYDNFFWRDGALSSQGIAYEHTAFTSIEKIKTAVKNKGYRTTTEKKTLLNYSTEQIDLSKKEASVKADNIKLTFSPYTETSFAYDKKNQIYKRAVNNVNVTDYVTKKQITVKNIIVVKANNWTLSGTTLQEFSNIGDGDGYYITNGYSIPIKWSKASREAQTVYKYLNGKEIKVSDGNTYIGIVPLQNSFSIK
ncbi:MAG: DUF3048 domain-containing protein [Bacilli bacterium]